MPLPGSGGSVGAARALICSMQRIATEKRTIDLVLEQSIGAVTVAAKWTFAESSVYVECKMISSVGDHQSLIKSTASGRFHAEPV